MKSRTYSRTMKRKKRKKKTKKKHKKIYNTNIKKIMIRDPLVTYKWQTCNLNFIFKTLYRHHFC